MQDIPSRSVGFTVVEILFVLFIVGLLSVLIAPKFFRPTQTILLESTSLDLVNFFHLAQSSAKTLKQPVIVSLNWLNDNDIESFSTTLPHTKPGYSNTHSVFIPDQLTCSINYKLDAIHFQENSSWKLYYESAQLSEDDLVLNLSNELDLHEFIFYPNSQHIQHYRPIP